MSMRMDIKPILATLTRHRVSALLIMLEIALACAVLCNALFMAASRIDLIGLDSGVGQRRPAGTEDQVRGHLRAELHLQGRCHVDLGEDPEALVGKAVTGHLHRGVIRQLGGHSDGVVHGGLLVGSFAHYYR